MQNFIKLFMHIYAYSSLCVGNNEGSEVPNKSLKFYDLYIKDIWICIYVFGNKCVYKYLTNNWGFQKSWWRIHQWIDKSST